MKYNYSVVFTQSLKHIKTLTASGEKIVDDISAKMKSHLTLYNVYSII